MEPRFFFFFIRTYKMLVPKNRLGNKCPVTSIGVITGSGIRKLFFQILISIQSVRIDKSPA